MVLMKIVIILLCVVIAILFFYIFFFRNTLRKMTTKLRQIRMSETNELVQIDLGNQAVEDLAHEINILIKNKQKIRGEAIRTEHELHAMITSMSHDLRTPLTAMIGYLQLLEDTDTSMNDQKRYVSIVHERAEQLYTLIQSFFALSTLQSGKEELNIEKIDLTTLVQNITLSYYDMFTNNGQNVVFNLPKQPSMIFGDKVACERMVENVLLNALQHGDKEIDIAVVNTEHTVSFAVKNTLHKERKIDENRVFDRLYTGEESRIHHRGFGLAIVKRLMEQMDGEIQVEIDKDDFNIRCIWKK